MLTGSVIRQLLVAGSVLLAAMSVGFSVAFPSVLLKQLAHKDSAIHLDLDTASWIGSIHGLAGIPSIIMPALMQWIGRKFIFIAACLISISGWIIAFTATSPASILISESFHGFGSHSIMAVGMLSMSEMLSPRFRNVLLPFYLITQVISMALVDFVGWYMNWRTVSLMMSIPIVVATIFACLWTESPSWLAFKGKFDKCAETFVRLRGSSTVAKTELEELLSAQKEHQLNDQWKKQPMLEYFWTKMKCRDFYLPCAHVFVLLDSMYWSGCMVTLIYGSEIFQRATNSKDSGPFGSILLNYAMIASCVVNSFLRSFSAKKVVLSSVILAIICLLSASAINYSQQVGFISTDSHLSFYIIVAYMFFLSVGVSILLSMPAELVPVKHRGVGGPLYVIFSCVLHTTSLKLAPYLFIYINLWGTWLLYALNATFCCLVIWKSVPETKGKTLQELEDFYAYGNFDKRHRTDDQACLTELLSNKIAIKLESPNKSKLDK